MKRLGALLLVLGSLRPALADQPTLQEARTRWLHGNYEESRALYEQLAKSGQQPEAAAVGLSRCRQSQGEYDKALGAVDAALRDRAASATLHARRAELLYLRGRWDDAEQA